MPIQIAVVLCVCCLMLCGTTATAEPAVPIEQEPAHRLVLQNEHVRVFEIRLPPGAETLWHVHMHDGISVRLADATIADQPQDGTEESLAVRRGAVAFGATPAAYTHRVRNAGETLFHNVYVELRLDPDRQGADAATKSGQRVEFENARVRALRRILAPGEVAPLHTHASSTIAVPVSSGSLEISSPSGVSRTAEIKAGTALWIEPGTTHALKNVGAATVEIVDIELR